MTKQMSLPEALREWAEFPEFKSYQSHRYEAGRLVDDLADAADRIERLTQERDEWAAKWHRIRAELAELKYPGMKGVIRPLANASDEPKADQAKELGWSQCSMGFTHPATEGYAGLNPPLKILGCVCGEPHRQGVQHRTDGPCFVITHP